MKKISVIFSIIILITFWSIFIVKNDNTKNLINQSYEKVKEFEKLNAYELALEEYDFLQNNGIDVANSKMKLLIKNKDNTRITKYISSLGPSNSEEIKEGLYYLLENKEYKSVNKLILLLGQSVDLSQLKNKLNTELIYGKEFYNNIIQVTKDNFLVKSLESTYLINKDERVLLNDKNYNLVSISQDDQYYITEKDGKYFAYNFEKNLYSDLISKPKYLFDNKFYVINTSSSEQLINSRGKSILNSESIYNDRQYILEKTKNTLNVYNKNLNKIFTIKNNTWLLDNNNIAIYEDRIITRNNKEYLIDLKKKKVISKYEKIENYNTNYYSIFDRGKWATINLNGEIIDPFTKDKIIRLNKEICFIKKADTWFIKSANQIKKTKITEIKYVSDDEIIVGKLDGGWQLIKIAKNL